MLGCSSWPVIWASSMKRSLLAGVGLVEQVLDGHFAADVAVHGPQDGTHAASGDLAFDDVASVLLGPPGQEFAGRTFDRGGPLRPRVTPPSTRRLWPDCCRCRRSDPPQRPPGSCRGRNDQRLLAGRAFERATGELWLDLELHAAVRTGEGDHGGLAAEIGGESSRAAWKKAVLTVPPEDG